MWTGTRPGHHGFVGKAGESEQAGCLVSSAPERLVHTGKLSSSEKPQFIHQEQPDLEI